MNDTGSEEDRKILQEMVGRFGAPAFVRRGKLVETTWTHLLEACAMARIERLAFVRLRLGQLLALAGGWDAVRGAVRSDAEIGELQRLHDELQPQLQLPLEATTSKRVLRAAARDLVEAIEMFNARWTRWLAKVDLKIVNQARENYNRYYLLEKECAVGSARLARIGFVKLEPIVFDEVAKRFPLLTAPHFEF